MADGPPTPDEILRDLPDPMGLLRKRETLYLTIWLFENTSALDATNLLREIKKELELKDVNVVDSEITESVRHRRPQLKLTIDEYPLRLREEKQLRVIGENSEWINIIEANDTTIYNSYEEED